jgi:hypothetical protein
MRREIVENLDAKVAGSFLILCSTKNKFIIK